ncbi:MAG: hypothetical protein LBK61_07495 [Spirochaetaceae bacterium]|nr:hypothetical protein [Spirochaetaceae bacterium]
MPLRGAKTRRVFIPDFALSSIRFNPIPGSGRESAGTGRTPPYGGVPLRGAKTRRVFIPALIIPS